ncbi:uncharacterized protein LOC135225293 [Macrobrachium nipponense]|uniref:uncharacterized protein LOC135225293 n=1 Tax=Macrobrachium nipponense TaxID=159736 RepID=UPI0030C8C502
MDDLFDFCCRRGVDSGFRAPGALFDAAVDYLEPEIAVDHPNSSLMAPSSAFARPTGLALLAALALAVCWMYGMSGRTSDVLEECMESERMDVYDSEDDDDELNISECEDNDDEDETDVCDSEYDLETDVSENENDLETDASKVSRLEESLELEDLKDSKEELVELEDLEDSKKELEETPNIEELESTEEERELPRLHQEQPDVERQRLEETLEKSQVYGTRMEYLWKEAEKAIEQIQRQLEDKDILLEKKADERAAMNRQIESACLHKEQVLIENRRLEHDLELALDRGEKIENYNKELKEKIVSLERQLEENDHLLKETGRRRERNEKSLPEEYGR